MDIVVERRQEVVFARAPGFRSFLCRLVPPFQIARTAAQRLSSFSPRQTTALWRPAGRSNYPTTYEVAAASDAASSRPGGQNGSKQARSWSITARSHKLSDEDIDSSIRESQRSNPLAALFDGRRRFLRPIGGRHMDGVGGGARPAPSDLGDYGFDPEEFLNLLEDLMATGGGFLTSPEKPAIDDGSLAVEPTPAPSDLGDHGFDPEEFLNLLDLQLEMVHLLLLADQWLSVPEMSKDSGKYSLSHKSSERSFDGVNLSSPKGSGRYSKTGSLDHAASLGDDDEGNSHDGSYRIDHSSPKGSSRCSKTGSLDHAACIEDESHTLSRDNTLSSKRDSSEGSLDDVDSIHSKQSSDEHVHS
ncbi:hypothetical protein NL676_030355 [Syzygium grande]|nr:hypothetical protein NL676_030355 [Syzygium grande]